MKWRPLSENVDSLRKRGKNFSTSGWYASLTPEEQAAEDKRIQEEEEKRRQLEAQRAIEDQEYLKKCEEEQKRQEEARRIEQAKAKKRKKIKIGIGIGVAALAVLIPVGVIGGQALATYSNQKAFEESATGRFLDYIQDLDGYSISSDPFLLESYTAYADIESRGRIYFAVEYKANYFKDPNGQTCDFRAITYLLPKEGQSYDEIDGYLFFNLDGSDNTPSFKTSGKIKKTADPCYSALAQYGSGTAITQYRSVEFDSDKGELVYASCDMTYQDWDQQYDIYRDEWVESGWTACLSTYMFVDQLFNEATGGFLYRS